MIRKIFKTGHSLAITVSKKALLELGWEEGDSVEVSANSESEEIVVRRKKSSAQLALNLNIRPVLGRKAAGR